MKKYFYTLCHAIPAALGMLCICLSAAAQDADTISGKIVDTDGLPVIGADCILYSLPDTVKVAWTPTDSSGRFMIPAKDGERYFLVLSMMSFEPIKMECGASDTVEVVMRYLTLDEVVVTPQELKTFGNKDRLLLSESAIKAGTNALDAISSMPQFKKSADNASISTFDNKMILVLINGLRMTYRDLAALQASDIEEINYYSNPPARFAHENVGAVIEVRTKKKKDKRYTLYLNTVNGVTAGYGTNSLYMTYTDSLNQVTAYYLIDYRALNKNLMNNSYEYPNYGNIYQGTTGSYNGQYHIGQVTYQRNQGKNLFFSKLEYRKNPGFQKYEQELVKSGTERLLNSRRLNSDYSSYSADLYYSYVFNKDRSLSANVVNTFYTSESYNNLNSSSGYSFENLAENKSYSLIAEALYTDKIWNGNFNFGFYYQYKNLNQVYNNSVRSDVGTNKEYLFADYSNGVGKFSYTIGLGLENSHYKTAADDRINYFVFRPSVALNLQFAKSTSMRFSGAVYSSVPSVGELTNSIFTVDDHYFIQGNPELKPNYYYYTDLTLQYSSPGGKLYLSPTVRYYYYPNRNMPILYIDDNNVFQRTERISNIHEAGGSFNLSYRPFNWFTIRSYYTYLYSAYRTPNQEIQNHLHNYGFGLQFLPKNWVISYNANMPINTVNGDIHTRLGFNMNMSVLWKYKVISLGAQYIYNPYPSRVYADIDNFKFSEETIWGNFKHLVTVTFTLYIQSGKSRNQATRRLSNSDYDTGLTNYNKAK